MDLKKHVSIIIISDWDHGRAAVKLFEISADRPAVSTGISRR